MIDGSMAKQADLLLHNFRIHGRDGLTVALICRPEDRCDVSALLATEGTSRRILNSAVPAQSLKGSSSNDDLVVGDPGARA